MSTGLSKPLNSKMGWRGIWVDGWRILKEEKADKKGISGFVGSCTGIKEAMKEGREQ